MQHDTVLEGFGIRLVPLGVEHAPALGEIVDDGIWAGMSSPTPRGTAAMTTYVRDAVAAPGRLAFAVLGTGQADAPDAAPTVRGSTSLYEWVPSQGRVELGSTFYAREWWGGVTNPACKYLLLRHAFEDLGVARVALRADARNSRSIGAITRLGARPEGGAAQPPHRARRLAPGHGVLLRPRGRVAPRARQPAHPARRPRLTARPASRDRSPSRFSGAA